VESGGVRVNVNPTSCSGSSVSSNSSGVTTH